MSLALRPPEPLAPQAGLAATGPRLVHRRVRGDDPGLPPPRPAALLESA